MNEGVRFMGREVTRAAIVRALAFFDAAYPESNDYDGWLEKRHYRWALRVAGRLYPPKFILHLATDIPLADMTSAKRRAAVLRALGFAVGRK